MKLKTITSALMFAGVISTVNAEVCKISPGSVTCGKGTVSELTGNGMVSVNGTTINGPTTVNGMLTADDAYFSTLDVNGSVSLMQCTVNELAEIKGNLKAASTKFENSLDIHSSSTRLINSKIAGHLNVLHTDNQSQEVYLDNNSEVSGNISFNDGRGKVYVRGGSKLGGKVIGGEIINN
ncbi:hypothetical protein Lnau_2335 [Legionella nautarum]|uniref:Uncharacterized protein n=1 Tax=Legionella nautarum TaxID=45070 RepID=A0A0W0WMM7_9GAMM|nr:hypothetical protein [Legionella nautarum]KTD33584.1 hypothetical protein Lnau_2335 [Legionella nautarum]